MIPITTHMIISSINVTDEVLHNRRWTKMLHFMKPLHSNEELTNFPGSSKQSFYIGGHLRFLSTFHGTAKADWLRTA